MYVMFLCVRDFEKQTRMKYVEEKAKRTSEWRQKDNSFSEGERSEREVAGRNNKGKKKRQCFPKSLTLNSWLFVAHFSLWCWHKRWDGCLYHQTKDRPEMFYLLCYCKRCYYGLSVTVLPKKRQILLSSSVNVIHGFFLFRIKTKYFREIKCNLILFPVSIYCLCVNQ